VEGAYVEEEEEEVDEDDMHQILADVQIWRMDLR